MWEKNKGTTKCEKRIVKYENETVKYEKKVREPSNVRKKLIDVMLELDNIREKPSNMRKSKRATKYDKITVTCDIKTAQYKGETVLCEKKKQVRDRDRKSYV